MTYSPYKKRAPIKANQCKAPGCFFNVFSHGYCNRHQYFWKAKVPIPKYKKKAVNPNSFGFSSQLEMFMAVVYLAPRPILCPISGKNITDYFKGEAGDWVSCCAHILNKGRWPLFKLNPANIMLVDPEVHRLVDQGTEAQRIATGWDFSPFYDRQTQLKQEYESYRNRGTFRKDTDDNTPDETADSVAEETSEA